jgi:hypothetical protein
MSPRRLGRKRAVRAWPSAPEVDARRRGDEIVLREKGRGLARVFEMPASLPDDFLSGDRPDSPPRERHDL